MKCYDITKNTSEMNSKGFTRIIVNAILKFVNYQ